MTALLVHGNPETSVVWGPLIAALAERGATDVVAGSPPGFGAPVPDGFDATMTSYRDWLVDEIGRVGGGAPVDLVGHDWGSGHVLGVVAARGDLVRSWAADVVGIAHPDYVWHEAAQTWQTDGEGEAAIEAMVSMPADERAGLYAELDLPDTIARAMAGATDAEMGRCILALYRSAAQPAMARLGDALVAAPKRPGLVIDATADAYVPSNLGREMADALGAERLELDGAGHWWMVDRHDEAAERLVTFWDAAHE